MTYGCGHKGCAELGGAAYTGVEMSWNDNNHRLIGLTLNEAVKEMENRNERRNIVLDVVDPQNEEDYRQGNKNVVEVYHSL